MTTAAPTLKDFEIVSLSAITLARDDRSQVNKSALAELAQDIKLRGVLNPLTLRQALMPDGKYAHELIAGRRRLEAAKMAGLDAVPARATKAKKKGGKA